MFATYILGPFLTMLPRRWRRRVLATVPVHASRAAIISGILEVIFAIVGLIVWYSIYVTLLSAAAAHSSVAIPDQSANRIGMFAYAWFWLNPLTWVVAYFAFEGAVRFLAAAVTGETYGILPLVFSSTQRAAAAASRHGRNHARRRDVRHQDFLLPSEIRLEISLHDSLRGSLFPGNRKL